MSSLVEFEDGRYFLIVSVRLAYTSCYCSWCHNLLDPAKDVRISFVLFHVVEMVAGPLQLMQVVYYIDIFR